MSPGKDCTVAVTILGHFPDGRDEIRVVERHAPPTDTSENRVMPAEVIVDAGIKLIEAGKARSPAELLPKLRDWAAGEPKFGNGKMTSWIFFETPLIRPAGMMLPGNCPRVAGSIIGMSRPLKFPLRHSASGVSTIMRFRADSREPS